MAEMVVHGNTPALGMPDMDWTVPFLERGSTFSLSGCLIASDVPITRAWVENEVLYFEGLVQYVPEPPA
jgi:hypothetical protein